jgi:hypothetical protein
VEAWPASVPFAAEDDSVKGTPFRAPLATEFEGGNQRRRRSTTKNIATLEFAISMSNAQFGTFKIWVRDTLVDGTLPFTMQIWTGEAYAARTCSFAGRDPYQFGPDGFGRQLVTLTLDVEDY